MAGCAVVDSPARVGRDSAILAPPLAEDRLVDFDGCFFLFLFQKNRWYRRTTAD